MTRAATAPEIAKFASDGQWSDVLCVVSSPATVLACRVNGTFGYDQLYTFEFDGTTAGSYTGVVEGMTVLVGSAAGLSDHGIGCTSSSAGATTLNIIRTSEITIADNDYVTVLQEFGIWAKRDYPTYTDQLTVPKPTINAGGDRILELLGANVATTYALTGAASYVTTCSGGTVTNGTTSAPTITFTTPGEYLVKIIGTGANTAVSTTYRIVGVISAAAPAKNCILSTNGADENGWTASVQLYETQAAVRDRAKVLIFARDYYGGVLGSIGSVVGCENFVTIGWIAGNTIDYDVDGGGVKFDVKPASWWLDQEWVSTEALMIGDATGANWHHMASLTIDKMLWFLAEWRTTVLNSMDAWGTSDTRTAYKLIAPAGTAWEQFKSVAGNIQANIACTQYNELVAYMDTPLIPLADRTAIPSVVTLIKDDWESITIDKFIVQPTAQVLATGYLANGDAVVGIGGGHIPDRFGQIVTYDEILVASQEQLNVLAGNLFARDNTPYKFSISNLRGNNRLIEPGDRLTLTLTGSDNLGGIAYNGYIIVRTVDRSHDPKTGAWKINLEADAETWATRYCTGDIPPIVDPNDPSPEPDYPPIPIPKIPPMPKPVPPIPPPPPVVPPVDPSSCVDSSPANGPYTVSWDRAWIDGNAGTNSTKGWMPGAIRSGSASAPTTIYFTATSDTRTALEHLKIYGINGAGGRVITGTVTIDFWQKGYHANLIANFGGAGAVAIAGFELVMDTGADMVPAPLYCNDIGVPYPDTGGLSLYWDTGGSNFVYTNTRYMYEPENGKIGFYGTGKVDYNGGFFFVPYFKWGAKVWTDAGAVGSLYGSIAFSMGGAGAFNLVYDAAPYFSFKNFYVGIVKLAESVSQQQLYYPTDIPFHLRPTEFTPTSGNFSLSIVLMHSATVPNSRRVGLGTPQVYNICPGTNA